MPEVIDPQLRQPPRVGLLAAVPPEDPPNWRWYEGFTWDSERCDDSGTVAVACGSVGQMVPTTTCPATIDQTPFVVWAADAGSRMNLGRDWQGRARRKLAGTRSRQVAAEFWDGAIADANGYGNTWLTGGGADIVTDGASTALVALANVDDALLDYSQGERGMVHVTPQVLVHLAAAQAIERLGGAWVTPNENLVVADSGYSGNHPGGTPAGATQYIYGTLVPRVLMSPVQITGGPETREGVDYSTNDVAVFAYQLAAVDLDPCVHVAGEVNLAVRQAGS